MVTVGMYYDVMPGKDALFRAKFQEVLAGLEATPGHKRSFLYQRVDDLGSYAILSEWESRQAFLDFIRSDVFRRVTSWGREEVLRRAPEHTIYPSAEPLGPGPGPRP
jgi:heme-degrading monooxygenase HmoA